MNFGPGTNTAPSPSVPILHAGIQTNWKAYLIAATSIVDLRNRVQMLGTNDWRTDPYESLVYGIRSSQAYYGNIVIGAGGYDPSDDYRVDLPAPARPNGQGNQRDLFEALAVAHRLPADVFGGTFGGVAYYGGRVQTTTPNEWRIDGTEPGSGKLYMTPDRDIVKCCGRGD